MAHISNLSEELLLMIFKNLNTWQLSRVQKVCRAWYLPVHILFLEYVNLQTDEHIKQFIAAIDHNPNPLYLKAVKEILIDGSYNEDRVTQYYNVGTVKKLLFRFPNLQSVVVSDFEGLFEDFTVKLCKEFLQCCPKIERFDYWVHGTENKEQLFAILWKLKQLITALDVELIEPAIQRYGDTLQYLTSFPRLRKIEGCSYRIDSFQTMLRLVDKFKHLTAISITSEQDDEAYFTETYFESITTVKEIAIEKKLSNIKKLVWNSGNDLGVHSARFIKRYLTGLESLSLYSGSNLHWTESHVSAFSYDIVNLMVSLKKKGTANIMNLEITTLSRCILSVMRKMFADTPKNKRLLISINGDPSMNTARLFLEADQGRSISLFIGNEKSLNKIKEYLFLPSNLPTLKSIDEFKLHLIKKKGRHYQQFINADMYIKLLEKMPSLKKVELDISESYIDARSTQVAEFTRMEELVIRAANKVPLKQLLDKCFYSFPNLKRLSLQYFCGVWDEDTHEFQLKLAKFSLQNLKIDMTPVLIKISELRVPSMKEDFFVIEVEALNNSERYLYKATLDLSSIAAITDKDLHGYTRGEDYIRVRVTVKNVSSIDIFLDIYSRSFSSDLLGYSISDSNYKNLLNDKQSGKHCK